MRANDGAFDRTARNPDSAFGSLYDEMMRTSSAIIGHQALDGICQAVHEYAFGQRLLFRHDRMLAAALIIQIFARRGLGPRSALCGEIGMTALSAVCADQRCRALGCERAAGGPAGGA